MLNNFWNEKFRPEPVLNLTINQQCVEDWWTGYKNKLE